MTNNVIAALNLAITETGCSQEVAILMVLKTAIEAGLPTQQAHDLIFGAGSYQQMAGEVWEALQAA
jgi:hypothetical protein